MSRKTYQSKKSKEIHEELMKMDSQLVNHTYKADFDVPEAFWNTQKAQVAKVLERKPKTKIRFLDYRWYGAAAAGLLLMIWMLPNPTAIANTELNLDTIELSALEEYLLDEAESMDSRLSLEETFYDQELWIQNDE